MQFGGTLGCSLGAPWGAVWGLGAPWGAVWEHPGVQFGSTLGCSFPVHTRGCAVIAVPLLQGLIVLGEASPPDPAVEDSRPVRAEVKLEPGAERLVSASAGAGGSSCSLHSPGEGRDAPATHWALEQLLPGSSWESLILVSCLILGLINNRI